MNAVLCAAPAMVAYAGEGRDPAFFTPCWHSLA